jgi:hypothetical protein
MLPRKLLLTSNPVLQVDAAAAADADPLMANILLADTGVACVSTDCQLLIPAAQWLMLQHLQTQQKHPSCVLSDAVA